MRVRREGITLFAVLLVLGLGVDVVVGGCVSTRIQPEALPEQPIAFMHWADKPARKRAKAFESVSELPPMPENKFDPKGAEEMEIAAYLRAEHSVMLATKLAQHPSRLMLYWPQTEELERVAAAPPGARPLAWSPDHQRLLFVSSHRDGKNQLYEYDLVRKHLSRLTDGSREHLRGDYDRRGQLAILRLERVARRGGSRRSLHIASGGGQFGREFALGVHPGTLRLSSDGARVVYEQVKARPRRDGPTAFESFVAIRGTAPGEEERILTRGREPSLTPDDQWIVFASPSSAGYRLRRMRLDGTSKVAIGPGGVDERMPAVSPDGSYIAFIKDSGTTRKLFVRQFDGRRELEIVPSGWSESPVW